jgi:type I restriction enzyme S subunit
MATSESINEEGIKHSAARVLPAGTVVLSRTASVGFVTRMGLPMATSQDFVNWVCGPELDPEFLMYLFIRSREFVRALSSGAIHKTVYFPTVQQFWVCAPPVNEQRRIVADLRSQLELADVVRVSAGEQLRVAEQLSSTLLARAFERERERESGS